MQPLERHLLSLSICLLSVCYPSLSNCRYCDTHISIEDDVSLDYLLQKYSWDEILSLLDEIFNTNNLQAYGPLFLLLQRAWGTWASYQLGIIY